MSSPIASESNTNLADYKSIIGEKETALNAIVFGSDCYRPLIPPKKDEESHLAKKKRAWIDEDDDDRWFRVPKTGRERFYTGNNKFVNSERFEHILRERFRKTLGGTVPEWADHLEHQNIDNAADSDGKLYDLKFCLPESVNSRSQNELNFKFCTRIRPAKRKGGICSLKFCPTSNILLSLNRKSPVIQLNTIDGSKNALLRMIKCCSTFRKPASDAWFNTDIDRNEIIVTSQMFDGFLSFDLNKDELFPNKIRSLGLGHGIKQIAMSPPSTTRLMAFATTRDTSIYLYSSKSKEQVNVLNTSSNVSSICIDRTGNYLMATDEDACVRIWDLRCQRRCISRFTDSGNYSNSVINCSRGPSNLNNYVAIGSLTGFVNLYALEDILSSGQQSPQPIYECSNLKTGISFLEFNCDSKLLVIGSHQENFASRIVNTYSKRVYRNFPPKAMVMKHDHQQQQQQREACVAFSPNSGYLAFGDTQGVISLYRSSRTFKFRVVQKSVSVWMGMSFG
ncbi:hypothetical protein ACOME3_005724 [Neoechinorhynchus agilis]